MTHIKQQKDHSVSSSPSFGQECNNNFYYIHSPIKDLKKSNDFCFFRCVKSVVLGLINVKKTAFL